MIKFLTDPTFSIKMAQFIIELYNAQPRQFYRRRWVTAVSSRLFKRSKIRLVSRSVSGFQKWSILQVFERVKKKLRLHGATQKPTTHNRRFIIYA